MFQISIVIKLLYRYYISLISADGLAEASRDTLYNKGLLPGEGYDNYQVHRKNAQTKKSAIQITLLNISRLIMKASR